ncbi:growth-regulating factor 4-like isoform X1 [Tripterygium wilfordii]|uniref:Growth-regulating factor 4-like isoform X1 n=1 Tax=Tripterygium wilfordii TaxID=458696 RepID=A0A7J7BVU0_TRIWF|nr:growth-regulating factor 4-like isoform X1 [Tripterygium wilfordii]
MTVGRYRYLQGLKPEVGERSFFTENSGNDRGLQMDSTPYNSWPVMPPTVSSFPSSKSSGNPMMQHDYPQHLFFSSEFASGETLKQPEAHALRPFFDEWPKTQDSWSGLDEERSNHASFSTTQLSISIPMSSSDFSTTSS